MVHNFLLKYYLDPNQQPMSCSYCRDLYWNILQRNHWRYGLTHGETIYIMNTRIAPSHPPEKCMDANNPGSEVPMAERDNWCALPRCDICGLQRNLDPQQRHRTSQCSAGATVKQQITDSITPRPIRAGSNTVPAQVTPKNYSIPSIPQRAVLQPVHCVYCENLVRNVFLCKHERFGLTSCERNFIMEHMERLRHQSADCRDINNPDSRIPIEERNSALRLPWCAKCGRQRNLRPEQRHETQQCSLPSGY
jgi:hypothetical protein